MQSGSDHANEEAIAKMVARIEHDEALQIPWLPVGLALAAMLLFAIVGKF